MKISMFMLVVGAAIVFAAPIANADSIKSHLAPVQHHKVIKATKTAKVATKKGVSPAPRPPLYIFVPGYSGPPMPAAAEPDQCASYQIDCTDQQLCELWGVNCSTAGDPAATQPAVPVAVSSAQLAVEIVAPEVVQAVLTSDTGAASTSDDSYEDC